MDEENSSLTWLESLCQKVQVMCSDVDEMLQQETQIVVDQLETIGTNVEQFCSNFVKEMLPQSIVESTEGTKQKASNRNTNKAESTCHKSSANEVCVENKACGEVPCLCSERLTISMECDLCSVQNFDVGPDQKSEASHAENQDVEKQLDLVALGSNVLLNNVDIRADGKLDMTVTVNEDQGVEKHPELEVCYVLDKNFVSEESATSSFVNRLDSTESDASDVILASCDDATVVSSTDVEGGVKSLSLNDLTHLGAKRPWSSKKNAKQAVTSIKGQKHNIDQIMVTISDSSNSGSEQFCVLSSSSSSSITMLHDEFSDSDWEIV